MSKKPAKKQQTVPAWVCPNCGKSHPITVRECCKAPTNIEPFKPYQPWTPPPQDGPWPRIWWVVPPEQTGPLQPWHPFNQPYCGESGGGRIQ